MLLHLPGAISFQPFVPVVGRPFRVAPVACANSRKAEALPYMLNRQKPPMALLIPRLEPGNKVKG